jgi:hypothetical protein
MNHPLCPAIDEIPLECSSMIPLTGITPRAPISSDCLEAFRTLTSLIA